MGYDEGRLTPEAAHHILLEGREQLTVSGVEEVESFDENTIVMVTAKGTLVCGERTCTLKSCPWTAEI